MELASCFSCQKKKSLVECGACRRSVCKRCAETLEPGHFSFLKEVPEHLNHRTYCAPCYVEKIAPALTDYERSMARARGVFVFLQKKSEETRLLKRTEKPMKISDCLDPDEALLRLAFFAAEADFNALVDVNISAVKVRNFGYQSKRWSATGIPTHVNKKSLDRMH